MRGVAWLMVLVGGCGGSSAQPDAAAAADAASDAAPAAAPDLRFHWVGAEPAFQQAAQINLGYLQGACNTLSTMNQSSWSPLELQLTGLLAHSYAWEVASFTPSQQIQDMLAIARCGPIASLSADLAPHLDGREVVVSIDLVPEAYAFVTNGTQDGAPAYHATVVNQPRAVLDDWIASEAAAGRVVTALSSSPSAGNIQAYSFDRDGDATAYETRVLDATGATLVAQATVLADAGYIITAFGRVGEDATVLVGTRKPGAAPRTLSVQTLTTSPPDLHAGDAIVAWVYNGAGAGSTVVLER